MKLFSRILHCLLIILATALFIQAQPLTADDCSWEYAGRDRADVKNRLPPQRSYRRINGGNHITIDQWYDLVCPFGLRIPDKADIDDDLPMRGFETLRVTLKGYLLEAKFERAEDHDIHAELGATKDGEGPHVIVEVPAMPEYCRIRKQLWDVVREDRRKDGKTRETSEWSFVDPPQVLVTGYIFLDSHHWNNSVTREQLCRDSGGRGSEESGESLVEGLWELHPVIGFTPLRPVRRSRRNR